MRAVVKGMVERALIASGIAAWRTRGLRGRTLVLAYHNILPPGAQPGEDRALHLPLAAFCAQLDLLAATCEIIPLGTIFEHGILESTRPRIAITFDDAYRGAILAGIPELARRGLAATVFVPPGLLGAASLWWDDLLASSLTGSSRVTRRELLWQHQGRADLIGKDTGILRRREPLDPHCGIATAEELSRALAAHPGLEFGAHSWNHPNLAAISATDLDHELSRPLEWLNNRFPGRARPWLAYPYGLWSPDVAAVVKRHGYQAAWRVDGGWSHAPVPDPFTLPRLNIGTGLSLNGIRLRLADIGAG
ncbi:MAG: polysaccharide deacetylase family protein [Gemmatimonadota bacterium]|nr:polysaccharide deacetylase family protein [Gemmatimonadota bacterium]MDZ4865561.1 polysaccharide deacetylase family protein [Gemmatimonadota bacterium]